MLAAGSWLGLAKRVALSWILGVVSRLDVPSCRFGEATGWRFEGGSGAAGTFVGEPRSTSWGRGGGGGGAPLKRL